MIPAKLVFSICIILSVIVTILYRNTDLVTVLTLIQTFDNLIGNPRFFAFLYVDETPLKNEVFDFIVVGAGSSGSVIANRLSEINNWKVLLLEVGEYPNFFIDVPAIAAMFQFTNLNWKYLMEKQDNMCLGLEDQRMPWPRGKGLGGTSLINYMIHVRGNRNDYDKWASLGNPGWGYDDVLPYFLKSEDSLIKISDPNYHNTGGYLNVMDVPFRTASVTAFVKACQEANYSYVDYNGKQQLGVSYVQATLRKGKRCSAEKAFLRPIRKRPNLRILIKAQVTKLLINPQTKECYGVAYKKDSIYHKAIASKEVILSAGALNSPQLLMLSGIGPKNHLQQLGISLLKDLPVGQKLYDHLCFLGLTFTINQSIVIDQDAIFSNPSAYCQMLQGKGSFTTLGGVEALLYYKSPLSTNTDPVPDIEFIYISGHLNTDKGQIYRKTFRITDKIYNTVWKPLEDASVWTVYPMLLHPKSYGYLQLRSQNPNDPPKFYGNYFTDPDNNDIQTFIAAIREIERVIQTLTYQKLGTKIVDTKIPGCETFTFDTDEYWECALRHISVTLHHQISTCKMGPSDDSEAVVDSNLAVHGVKKLRVADTSIIPVTLSAHTNVPAYMIGEKASDLIKKQWL